ncbi:MAG: hypothetical protein HPY90_04655 [Syntrophothermus sp.]|uniref:hypothetical protein n=1 Tax=Syntrophothermus sp. TaxID=2736299 RepID=UPI00258016AA|nr:hypothetical protein [Syntrophothermus sp.]NSW82558.1 hypothetical protein [Syntrophothermus sp.]
MPATSDIASRLETAGFDDFCIDYERGIAIVFFEGLLARETPARQHLEQERRRREFQERYYWAGYELRRRDRDGVEEKAGA